MSKTRHDPRTITSGDLSLAIANRDRDVFLTLTDETTGRTWLDGPIVYRVQTTHDDQAVTTHRLAGAAVELTDNTAVVTGQAQHLAVRHEFELEAGVLHEKIRLHNTTEADVCVARLEIGATLPLTLSEAGDYGCLRPEVGDMAWVPIPTRRHPEDSSGSHEQFSAADLISRRPDYWFGRNAAVGGGPATNFRPVDAWFADGWCWTAADRTLVVLKHATEHCELCPLDAEDRETAWLVRIGGVTLIESHPQGGPALMPARAAALGPGQTIELGEVCYQPVDGDWQAGYAAFRDYFDSQGYVPPANFDPPVHWNQLYDMASWHTVRGYEDRRGELYTLEALWDEADKATAYHCESLYLDPGWDTAFGSSVWDEARLGPQAEFAAKLKRDHGLGLSLHCPLAHWSNPEFYPAEARFVDADGRQVPEWLCSGSRQYLEENAERLRRLCADGCTFLMYDGSSYTGPCCSPDHGHPVPYTQDDQVLNYRWLCDAVQEKYPDVLIELHDPQGHFILPKHFPHRPGWNVENWGNEYMWTTTEDLFTGKMKFLDYVRRAYSIPSYLHISLINDNEHGLALWYAASTCRHLGIGGTHPNSQVAEAQKGHMAKYRKLKRFFAQGQYFALDESTHLHYLEDIRAAVLLLFNFSDESVHRADQATLPPGIDLGNDLLASLGAHVAGDGGTQNLGLNSVIPPRGVRVLLLRQRGSLDDFTMTW